MSMGMLGRLCLVRILNWGLAFSFARLLITYLLLLMPFNWLSKDELRSQVPSAGAHAQPIHLTQMFTLCEFHIWQLGLTWAVDCFKSTTVVWHINELVAAGSGWCQKCLVFLHVQGLAAARASPALQTALTALAGQPSSDDSAPLLASIECSMRVITVPCQWHKDLWSVVTYDQAAALRAIHSSAQRLLLVQFIT